MKYLSEIHDWHEMINTVVCGDCLPAMQLIPDGTVDLVLTDPPYGISIGKQAQGKGGGIARHNDYGENNWDNFRPRKEYFDEMMRVSKNQIIFGGNYFVENDNITNSPCWIVWDKDNGSTDFADCELAWTSFRTAVRKFKWKWSGMLQENMKQKDFRYHPTQKPLELMRWCIENYGKEAKLICDPFGGSGTTARACKDMGKDFIIIEKEEKYCSIIEKRLEQLNLF